MQKVLGFFSLFWIGIAHCATAPQIDSSPQQEYLKRISPGFKLSPLGQNPFGESLDLRTGRLMLNVTDVELKGIGPDILISRSFDSSAMSGPYSKHTSPMADWMLELPRITSVIVDDKTASYALRKADAPAHGTWQVGAGSTARCSAFAKLTGVKSAESRLLDPDDWWQGVQLVVPGETPQTILKKDASNLNAPAGVTLVTSNNWAISCLNKTLNGEPGEAFLAVSPDGTRYWFDWLAFHPADALIMPEYDQQYPSPAPTAGVPIIPSLERTVASFYPSKIEDRFGNNLIFTYSGGELNQIKGSDGRLLTLTWKGVKNERVVSVVTAKTADAGERKWVYTYKNVVGGSPSSASKYNTQLGGVANPDGTYWDINLRSFSNYLESRNGYGQCYDFNVLKGTENNLKSGSIRHPSGLIAKFDMRVIFVKRYGVPAARACAKGVSKYKAGFYAFDNAEFMQLGLVGKNYSGAGANQSWTYAYAMGSVAATLRGGVTPTATTMVVNPDSTRERYTFNNTWGESEGDLVKKEIGVVLGSKGEVVSAEKTESFVYAPSNAGGYPVRIGTAPEKWANRNRVEVHHPIKETKVSYGVDTFTRFVESFDAFANPLVVVRSSSLGAAQRIKESISYYHDRAKWVIGQVAEVKNLDSGEISLNNKYDLASARPSSRSEFGLLRMHYAWDIRGNLSSYTDPNGKSTKLSEYKLGVPQRVLYPDGTQIIALVNGFGEVVSVTDQVGAVRKYSYNPAGWMLSETQPSNDSVVWLGTSYKYEYPSGSLKVTKTIGNQKEETLYDAMLRPTVKSTSGGGISISTATRYDWKGRTVFESYPVADVGLNIGLITVGKNTTYDSLDRVTKVELDSELGKLATKISYLPGLKTKTTDPRGGVVTTSYQALDNPSYNMPTVVQNEFSTQTIARDIYGKPLSITQSGTYNGQTISLKKTFTYDIYHRLCSLYEPETGSYVRALDAGGNIQWEAYGQAIVGSSCQQTIPATQKIVHSYDSMNRLLQKKYGDGTDSVSFSYDALGKIKTATSGASTWSYVRNKRGLLTQEVLTIDGLVAAMNYDYNEYGVLSKVTYPAGNIIGYNPDVMGRPTIVGPFATGIKFFPNGEIQRFAYGNGFNYLATQNARQILNSVSYNVSGVSHFKEDMTLDPGANLTKIVDSAAGARRTKTMQYDLSGRLIQASAPGSWGVESYQYDPLNNVRIITSGNKTRQFNYDLRNLLISTQVAQTKEHVFTYDSQGNVRVKNGNSLIFNIANQLKGYMGVESYRYDAFGNRVAKIETVNGLKKYYGYGENGKLLFEMSGDGKQKTSYYYIKNFLLAKELN